MRRSILVLAGLATLATATALLWAGPDCGESGDAGSLPADAQSCTTPGGGPLKSIKGQLAGLAQNGLPDTEDMYLILIDNPAIFCARTVLPNQQAADCCGGNYPALQGTNFNTQIWLFKFDESGLLGNDDNPADPPRSLIGNAANDASGAMVTTPGLYYLAVSGGPGNDPQSAAGAMFNQALVTEVSGPDGPGGGNNTITSWAGGGPFGEYEILLCGVSYIPEEGIPTVSEWGLIILAALLLAGGAVFILRRRVVGPVA
jgi:hypothetical protein